MPMAMARKAETSDKLQRGRQALGDQVGDRPAVLVGKAEIALRRIACKAAELHDETDR